MRRAVWGLTVVAGGLALVGCGSAEPPKPTADAAGASIPPEQVVQAFLEAVRTGNDDTATNMLSPVARQKTAEKDLAVAPPGSDTASFTVGEVEMIDGGGAHVASTWTDLDEQGKPRTDSIVWMLRLEAEGWRVVGMATRVFPDQPPLFLNFENPDDMIRKQQLVQQEMERRAGGGAVEGPVDSAPRNAAKPPQAGQPAGLQ
ncbi:MAG: hypothetical protein JNG90_07360 [Planctomycetaceae bacterium]|nr:hypothetical protein [Planctomycetaceae bacterium]